MKTSLKTLAVEIFDPTIIALASQDNVIQQNNLKASTGISVIGTHSHGRVRIIGNSIESLRFGVKATSAGDCSTNYLNSLFIADNTIDIIQPLSAPGGSSLPDTVIGIGLQNTNCVQVGSNSINTSQPFISPGEPSNSNFNHIGIKVKEGQDNRISKPTISNFEFGLLMDDDANSTKFSCLTLNNCNVGIGFKDVGQIVHDVYDFNSGGSPRSVGVSFNSVMNRVYFSGGVTTIIPKWYYNSGAPSEFPGSNINLIYLPVSNAPASSCIPLPNQKGSNSDSCSLNYFLTSDRIVNKSQEVLKITSYNLFGQIIESFIVTQDEEVDLKKLTDMMILIIESKGCVDVKKVHSL